MSIEIKCDWCGRHMSTVSYQKAREYIQKHGEVCGHCTKKITALEAFFDKKRERFMRQFDRLLDTSKNEFSEEVKRLANVRDSD